MLSAMGKPASATETAPSPYEAAIEAALGDYGRVQDDLAEVRETTNELNQRARDLSDTVKTLLPLIPPENRGHYLQRLEALGAPPAPVRGSAVLGNVVNLLSKRKDNEVTSAELKEQLADAGPRHDPKAIDNVLGYLAKTGQIRRVSRGRYFITGLNLALDLGQDFGAGLAAPEDKDD
jgi:hypothetical protein